MKQRRNFFAKQDLRLIRQRGRQISQLLKLLHIHSSLGNLIAEEYEIKLGTQMFNLYRWYMRMSNEKMDMFGVKYRDHDFYRGEDDFWVYFEDLHAIYHRQALDVSIITIWVL